MDISTHSTRTPTLAPKVRMLQRRRASVTAWGSSHMNSSSFGEDEEFAASCSNLHYQESTTNLASMISGKSKTPLPLRRTHSTASSSSTSGERLQAITQEVLTLVGSVGVVAPSSSSSQKKEPTTKPSLLQSTHQTDQYRPGFDMDVAYLSQALGVPPSFLLGQELTKQRVKSMGRTTTTMSSSSHKKKKTKDAATVSSPTKRSPGKTSSRKINKKHDGSLLLQRQQQEEIPDDDDVTSQTVSSSCSSSSASVDSVKHAKQKTSFWEAVSTKMLQSEQHEWIQSLSEDDDDYDDEVASVSSQSTSKHSNTRKAATTATTVSFSSTTASPIMPLAVVAFVAEHQQEQDYDCCTNLDDVLFGKNSDSKQYQLQVLEDQFRQAQQLQAQHTKALEAAQHKVDATDRRLAWQAQMGL